mmetsp:Transcript_171176/g.548708  ORF Transcript_171176/g.548708 Transcript_171176/m.548708 type:complete len:496 (-) Transcript_171176:11-1498(-)
MYRSSWHPPPAAPPTPAPPPLGEAFDGAQIHSNPTCAAHAETAPTAKAEARPSPPSAAQALLSGVQPSGKAAESSEAAVAAPGSDGATASAKAKLATGGSLSEDCSLGDAFGVRQTGADERPRGGGGTGGARAGPSAGVKAPSLRLAGDGDAAGDTAGEGKGEQAGEAPRLLFALTEAADAPDGRAEGDKFWESLNVSVPATKSVGAAGDLPLLPTEDPGTSNDVDTGPEAPKLGHAGMSGDSDLALLAEAVPGSGESAKGLPSGQAGVVGDSLGGKPPVPCPCHEGMIGEPLGGEPLGGEPLGGGGGRSSNIRLAAGCCGPAGVGDAEGEAAEATVEDGRKPKRVDLSWDCGEARGVSQPGDSAAVGEANGVTEGVSHVGEAAGVREATDIVEATGEAHGVAAAGAAPTMRGGLGESAGDDCAARPLEVLRSRAGMGSNGASSRTGGGGGGEGGGAGASRAGAAAAISIGAGTHTTRWALLAMRNPERTEGWEL